MKRWQTQAPFASGSYFTQRLEMDGLVEDDLLYFLAEPAEAVQSRLASSQTWLGQLSRQFSDPASRDPLPLPSNMADHKASGFLVAVAPMLLEARERVRKRAQEMIFPFEPGTVTEAFFASLAQQVLAILSRTIVDATQQKLSGLALAVSG